MMMLNKHNSNSNTIPNNAQEIPITAHIFEGHLYFKENNKWTWRLFRFDGSSLTCLSSKRNKLPPNTLLDLSSQSMADNRPISFLTSSSTMNSLTSPLLATPTNKSVRLSSATINDLNTFQQQQINNNNNEPPLASYYQLPKWTIDMLNISSISILKPANNNNNMLRNSFNSLTANSKSKAFSIRTYDGGLYIMKAQKQHDLERWIFVLAKMWKFSQAARELYPPRQQQQLASPPDLSPHHSMMYANTPIMLSSLSGLENNNDKDHMVSHQYSQQQQQMEGVKRSTVYNVQQEQQQQNSIIAPSPQPPICLSDEKVLWIEEWIKSLAELGTCGDSTPELDYKSAYEAINHVYEPSIVNSSTASSKRRSSIRKRPSMSKRSTASSNHKKKMKDTAAANFNMDFFQDVNTIYTGTDDGGGEVASNTRRRKSTIHPQQPQHHQSSLKYHSSTRQQKIKLVRNNTSPPLPIQQQDNIADPHIPPVIINDPFIYQYSPLENLKKRVSSSQYTLSSHLQQQQQQEEEETKAAAAVASDENVCLADVQKILQKMDINKDQEYNKVRPNSTFIKNSTLSAAKDKRRINIYSWAPDVSTLFFT